MAWEENSHICLHMQLTTKIFHPVGLKKHRLGCLFYGGRIYVITYLMCIFAL